jgi:hypothetical protein
MDITNEELNKLMADSATDAITATMNEFNFELDGSVESIGHVDNVILSWIDKYKDKALEDDSVFTICNIYGAYIGEIFREKIGGSWHYDKTNENAPYVVLEYGGKSYAFAGICYQRLVNDSEISVKYYFDKAVENSQQ